jgi:HK97 family phage portal protein
VKLIHRLAGGRRSWSQPPSWAYDDYRLQFLNTPTSGDKEEVDSGFVSMVQTAYKRNGILFALNLARMSVFSQASFMFQQELDNGRPGELFSTPELALLRKPWLNGTTGDLLARMIQDADLAGNAFIAKRDRAGNKRLRRLRPDWVTILMGTDGEPSKNPWELDADVIGYMYEPGGRLSTEPAHALLPSEVAHFAPIPDPEAAHRGMSWISPVIRELEADNAATAHKLQFFKNGATPQVVVSLDREVKEEQFKKLVAVMEAKHKGLRNAYKTWYMGGGADVTVVGKDLKQLDFRAVQGAGETRMAAAAGVPPVIAGFSEGLQAATYSNYGQARRRYADGTLHPLWTNVAGSLASIVNEPDQSRLWYDDRNIPFLREDRKDVAEILAQQALTIRQLNDAGFKPESVVAAVTAEDWSLLVHTGLFSVQLQPPGSTQSVEVTSPQKANELISAGWKPVFQTPGRESK